MSKKTKIIVAVVVIIVVIIVAFFMMKGDAWTETAGGDINGGQYDIKMQPSGTVDEDKKTADSLGAVSFMRRGGYTWYKNAKGPVTTGNTGGVLYVKK